jgi:lauroyl/myristoyl acyltransferase
MVEIIDSLPSEFDTITANSLRNNNFQIKGKDHTNAEFNNLQYLWKAAVWMQNSGFYRPFIHIPEILRRSFGMVMGHLMLRSKKRQIITGINALFPKLSKRRKNKIMHANMSYMGNLMFDCMFCVPAVAHDDVYLKYLSHENLHYLDEALAKGKGVIMPTLHTGQFFHALGSIFMHPSTKDPSKRYNLVVLGGRDNAAMFAPITARYPNYYVLETTKFSEVKNIFIEHLKRNHIIMLYYDFTSKDQIRIPFAEDPHAFLKSTPQSVAALHFATGAPILPVVTCPAGQIGKSTIKFLDPTPMAKISEELENVSKDEFHRLISLTLNQQLHPYILKYTHVWEELMAFGSYVNKQRIYFEKGITVKEALISVQNFLINMITNSYEPNRNDEDVKQLIQTGLSQVSNALNNPNAQFCNKRCYIKYFDQNSSLELSKILKSILTRLKMLGESDSEIPMIDLINKIALSHKKSE